MPSANGSNSGNDTSRAIYDVVQSFIGLLSPDGTLLDANRSSLDFIGMDLEQVVGSPFCQTPWWRDCQASQEALKNAIRRGASGKASHFEARHTGKDGNTIEVDFSLEPIFDDAGDVAFLVPEAKDITKIKKTAIALFETKARLGLAYEAAEIGTWDWDLVTRQLHWSDRQFELFGVARPSGPMDFETAIANIHPEDRDRVVAATIEALENNITYRDEFRVIHQDGSIHWLFGQGNALHRDADGKPQSMTGVNYDITDRKNAVFELAQINQDLEARVARRTRALEREMRARQKAQEALSHAQRLESIGQLAGGMAHDCNNLLAVISGNLELALMQTTDDGIVDLIQEALEAVASGASLNQRLLSFAQRRSLDPVSINISDRIEYTKLLLERTLDKNITLETYLSHDIHQTFVDPGEFDSALLNLVINARDAMPSGGKLRISARNRTFDSDSLGLYPAAQIGDYVQLSVSDTGTGMTRDVQENAMTPFFTTKDPGKSSGLGLSSVFGFARQSGGFVTIESATGEGSTISVYLPQSHASLLGKKTRAHAQDMPSGQGELVLAVEDDEAVLGITRKRLIALGYNVIEARTAAEAITQLETDEPISLVFSDVRMPGEMSGYDLARWLSENRPEIPILLTSGYNDTKANGHENFNLLTKPYKMTYLATSLRKALT